MIKYILIFLAGLLFHSKIVFAKNICFQFELVSSSPLETAATIQGAKFMYVNTHPVSFTTVDSRSESGIIVYTRNKGCIDNAFLTDNQNDISFSIITNDRHLTKADMTIYISVLLPNQSASRLHHQIWRKGNQGTSINFAKSFSLKELDPEKARKIEIENRKKAREKRIKTGFEQIKQFAEKIHVNRDEAFEKLQRKNEKAKIKSRTDNFKENSEKSTDNIDAALAALESLEVDAVAQDENPFSFEEFCFPNGTKIRTPNGTTTNIEMISEGDWVLSNNFEKSMCSFAEVAGVFKHEVYELVEVSGEGFNFRVTPNHPFYVLNGVNSFLRADELSPGHELLQLSGNTRVVDEIRIHAFDSPVTVYNLKVSKHQNYFATEYDLLTHNCDGFLNGAQMGVQETLKGLREAILHPLDTAAALGNVALNIDQVAIHLAKNIAAVVEEYPEYSNLEQGELIGKLTSELATFMAPGAGIKVGSYLAKIMSETKLGAKVAKALNEGANRAKILNEELINSWKAHPERGSIGEANSGSFKGPSSKKWDWDHIFDGHASWGSKAKYRGKDHQIFQGMSESQIKSHTQSAWRNRKNIGSQTDVNGVTRIRYHGTNPQNGKTVEFFYNKQTKTVETAFPVE